MAVIVVPDARLAQGEVVSMDDNTPLPNYTGPVYADLCGRAYVPWAHPIREDGTRKWDVINPGSTIVQSALDEFMRINTNV